jgi:hypothetical protein
LVSSKRRNPLRPSVERVQHVTRTNREIPKALELTRPASAASKRVEGIAARGEHANVLRHRVGNVDVPPRVHFHVGDGSKVSIDAQGAKNGHHWTRGTRVVVACGSLARSNAKTQDQDQDQERS